MPSFQHDQIWRIARMNSRMRGAGLDHGIEKRFSIWGLIWLPRPRTKRPLDSACRSLATIAVVIGFRAKATAIDVPTITSVVPWMAIWQSRNGSWLVSGIQTPSYPAASARRAPSIVSVQRPLAPPSIFMSATVATVLSLHELGLLFAYALIMARCVPACVRGRVRPGSRSTPPPVRPDRFPPRSCPTVHAA